MPGSWDSFEGNRQVADVLDTGWLRLNYESFWLSILNLMSVLYTVDYNLYIFVIIYTVYMTREQHEERTGMWME